jgi:pimeloyl-ACP methyl ester carboxylesterase
VVIGSPAQPGGASFQLSSDNPAFVAAGDVRQGFLPVVTVPEGQTVSNLFTIFGISVGQTQLRITPLSPGFVVSAFPLGAWDVNRSGAGSAEKFLDGNDPSQPCRDSGAATLTSNPSLLATCGKVVKGVASDGVNALLLRTVSGLAGTACFEIVSTSSFDQGTIQTPLTGTQSVSGNNYGFSYYTPPSSYRDTSLSRTITVEFTFTPNIGNGNTSKVQAQTTIIRPPVMLLHGVWSNGNGWNSAFLRNDVSHTTFAGDYAGTNASSFSTNQGRVQGFVAQALTSFRRKGYAATQADVIGHSMGGLLTRLYAGSQNFQRPDNLNKGDIHRLITLDTPHFGSNFANLLVELHRVTPAKTESTVSTLTGGSVVRGAVCDLAENSPALQGLSGGTSLMGQVITATGGPAGTPAVPARYWGGATIFGMKSFESALTETYCTNWVVDPTSGAPICMSTAFYFPQATVDAFRFREQNDAVVPLSSQQGGLGGTNFTAYIHFHIPGIPGVQRGITDGNDVATSTFQILDGPDGGLAPTLPAVQSNGSGGPKTVPGRGTPLDQQDYANQCSPGGVMKLNSASRPGSPTREQLRPAPMRQTEITSNGADARVNVVSPAAGASFAQGDTMTIVVQLTPPLTAANTVGVAISDLTHLAATWTTGLQFTATFVIPPLAIGPLTLTPDFTDTLGNVFIGAPVVVGVRPATAPVSLAFQQNNFFVAPGSDAQQLYLNGTFADGSVIDLSSSFAGTSYTTSNPAVIAVSGDGLVQIVGPGFASIAGRNSALADFATFVVEDPSNSLPPADVTAQVAIMKSGYRLDRLTGFFLQDVTVTNTSQSPLPAALYLVLSGLTNGVTLVNKSGLTQAIAPVGSSYLTLPLPGEGLTMPPGNSVHFTLQFLNPNRTAINYTANLFRTSVAP